MRSWRRAWVKRCGRGMESWSALCRSEATEKEILSRLEKSGLSSHMKQLVGREIDKPETQESALERTAFSAFIDSELEVQLKNAVFKELLQVYHQGGVASSIETPPLHKKEPLDFVRQVQEDWESKVRRGINALCTERSLVLARERSLLERDSITKKWSSLGADFPGIVELHPIFSPKDFLEVIIRVNNPNFSFVAGGGAEEEGGEVEVDVSLGLMKVQMNVRSLFLLREKFAAVRPSQVQVESTTNRHCVQEYSEKAIKVLKTGLYPLARQFCKSGSPVAHRRELWCKSLTIDPTLPEHAFHFEELKSSVCKHELLFEKLLISDVKKTAANDDNYFVFEDTMHQVLLCFLHDSSVLKHFEHISATPMTAYIQGNVGDEEYKTVYPPNGVVPFHGFSLYIAPICFLFDRPDHLYVLFKTMYLRYFIHLHCISSHPDGILSLCCQYESLLQTKQPELCLHFKKMDIDPLRLVFNWLMSAFSGYLDSHEVLLLWDRIVGHDSLSVLAILAVAVLEFRSSNLFKATSFSEAEAVVSDIRCLKVLPLLQQTLFIF